LGIVGSSRLSRDGRKGHELNILGESERNKSHLARKGEVIGFEDWRRREKERGENRQIMREKEGEKGRKRKRRRRQLRRRTCGTRHEE